MAFEHLTGTYSCRGFPDRPTGSPEQIPWAEGELFRGVQPDGTVGGELRFPADPVAPEKPILDLSGQADSGGDLSFSAVGRSGTDLAESRSSFHCRPGHAWDQASLAQRLTLVGTSVRTPATGRRPPGLGRASSPCSATSSSRARSTGWP